MPIRAYLDGHKFDGETIRLMGIAFEMALASLRPTPDFDDPLRKALAQRIIAVAQTGERDPERLCEAALKGVNQPTRSAAGMATPGQAPGGGPSGGRLTGPRQRDHNSHGQISVFMSVYQNLRVAAFHAKDAERLTHDLEKGLVQAREGLRALRARISAIEGTGR